MVETKQNAPEAAVAAEEIQKIHVFFACADGPTEKIARQLSDRLAHRLAGEFEFCATWLSFAQLDAEAVFLASARMAAEAQLVFFSAYETRDLPPVVKAWIEKWLPEKAGTDAALVVLLRMERRQPGLRGAAHRYFRELSRAAGLELFTCEFDPASHDRPGSWCGPVASEMITPPGEPRGPRGVKKPETALGNPARPKNSV